MLEDSRSRSKLHAVSTPNPFGDMVVSKMKFRANNDQSDTVVRNEGSDYVLVSVNVPEPSTVLLLGGGLLALVGFGRKYMKK